MRPLLLAIALVACHPQPAPVSVSLDAGDDCARACAKLNAWHCIESSPSPAMESCVDLCEADRALLDLDCISRASSKSEAQACGLCR